MPMHGAEPKPCCRVSQNLCFALLQRDLDLPRFYALRGTPLGGHSPTHFLDFFNWPTGFLLQNLPAIAGQWDHCLLVCLHPKQAAGPSGKSGEDLLEKCPFKISIHCQGHPPQVVTAGLRAVRVRHCHQRLLFWFQQWGSRKREGGNAVVQKVYVVFGSSSGRTGVQVNNKSRTADWHQVHLFGGRREKPTKSPFLCGR